MIVTMMMTIHFKADQDNPLMLLYPIIVAFYGWMAVVCREKWMFLPLFCSMGFEMLMAGARLMYIDSVSLAHKQFDPNDPSFKIMSDFYPAFVVEVQAHSHTGRWFRMREFCFLAYCAVVIFLTLLEIDLMNRERLGGAEDIQMQIIAARDNADVVGPIPAHPPPSYEAICAHPTACPILPSVCNTVVTPGSHTDLPPSYGEIMKKREEGGLPVYTIQTTIHIDRTPRSLSNSCSTARFSAAAAASTACSTSSCSLQQMPSCTTPSDYETGDFEAPTPLAK